MKLELNKWYYKEEEKSSKRSLYYFTENRPEDYTLSDYYIYKVVYIDGTSRTCIDDDYNAYSDNLEDLTPCDNP